MGMTVYYPRLSPANYRALSSEPDLNLPDTYDEWLDFAAKQIREIRLSSGIAVTICEIEIDPDEFAEFCHATGEKRTFGTLREFATQKGRDKGN